MKRKWGTFRTISASALQEIITNSVSVAQVMRHFGMVNTTGNQRTFWKSVQNLKLDANHFHKGKGSPLPKTSEHKEKLRAAKLEKYGVTYQESFKNSLVGNKWCIGHNRFLPKENFSPTRTYSMCKDCLRKQRICKTYNISYDVYETLLFNQHGCCAICKSIPQKGKYLFVDHDHSCCSEEKSCGKCIRGLLCNKCNTLVGWLECNKKLIVKAESYCKW